MTMIAERWLIGLVLMVSLFGAGFYKGAHYEKEVAQAREDAAAAAAAKIYQAQVEKNADLSAKLATAQATTNTIYKTITNEVQHVIERPIYNTCVLDADGVRLWNDANAGRSSSGANSDKPDGRVPNAASTGKPVDGGNAEKPRRGDEIT